MSKLILIRFVKVITTPFLVIGFTLVLFAIWLRAISGDKEAYWKILSVKEELKDVKR